MTNRLNATSSGILALQYGKLLIAGAAAYGLLITLTYSLFHDTAAVLFLLFTVAFNGLVFVAWRSAEGRTASAVLALALLARCVAALLFHHRAGRTDPFAGSPDAWSYHVWGVRLAEAFRHGDFPAITAWYQTGRWDVGYHYVLGLVYLVFGESLLVGRLLGAFFGALSVLMLLLVARRLVTGRGAVTAAVVYAFWPMSIGWSSETILRDSFVWFLLLAAVWLSLRLTENLSLANWCALVGALALLRYTRPYAAFFVIAGLGVAFVFAALKQQYRPVLARTAAAFVGVFVTVEVLFITISFPNAVSVIQGYDLPHWAMRSMPTKAVQLPSHATPASTSAQGGDVSSPEPLQGEGDAIVPEREQSNPPVQSTTAARESLEVVPHSSAVSTSGAAVGSSSENGSAPSTGAAAPSDAPADAPVSPTRSSSPSIAELPRPPDVAVLDAESKPQHSSVAGNAVRFLLGPFGWTFYLPGNSVWPVYAIWLWYLILPAAAAGALSLLLRDSVAGRALVVTSAGYAAVLMLVGRGDSYRQREMLVPLVIMMAIAGLLTDRTRRKVLIPLYAIWFLALAAAITLHVRSVNSHAVRRLAMRVSSSTRRLHVERECVSGAPCRQHVPDIRSRPI